MPGEAIRAARTGSYDSVSATIARGADVNELDKHGLSAGWYAALFAGGEAFELLERSGAVIVPAMRGALWLTRLFWTGIIGTFVLAGWQVAHRSRVAGLAHWAADQAAVALLLMWLGLLVGSCWIGMLLLRASARRQLRESRTRSCPYCGEQVTCATCRCPYCQEYITAIR